MIGKILLNKSVNFLLLPFFLWRRRRRNVEEEKEGEGGRGEEEKGFDEIISV